MTQKYRTHENIKHSFLEIKQRHEINFKNFDQKKISSSWKSHIRFSVVFATSIHCTGQSHGSIFAVDENAWERETASTQCTFSNSRSTTTEVSPTYWASNNFQHLDLSYNFLHSIPFDIGCPLPSLHYLDVRQNLMHTLNVNATCLAQLHTFDLSRYTRKNEYENLL